MPNKREAKKPDLEQAAKKFVEFLETIAALRHPETGCPWDNEQSHESLTKYMLEEAYEASEAMTSGISNNIKEELGDVLLQVVLNSQIGLDEGNFSILEVIDSINSKMRRRHPHVFADASRDKSDIKETWQRIKAEEAGDKDFESKGVFEKAKVHKVRPSNLQALKIGEIAKRIDFDWKKPDEVLSQFNSEVKELNDELQKGAYNSDELLDELGDVYFTLSQLTRHLGHNPEMISQRGNEKFLKRFKDLEKIAKEEGLDVERSSSEQLERLWKKAKLNS